MGSGWSWRKYIIKWDELFALGASQAAIWSCEPSKLVGSCASQLVKLREMKFWSNVK